MVNNLEEGYTEDYPKLSTDFVLEMDKKQVDHYKLLVETFCKYNSYRIGSVSIKNEDDGARNSSQCKEPSTFTNRGFSTEFWSFVSGSYPTIKGL